MKERGEKMGPNVSLEVGVDEVTAVDGATDGGGSQVFGGRGGRWVEKFLGGERTVKAVGNGDDRVTIAAMTGFD